MANSIGYIFLCLSKKTFAIVKFKQPREKIKGSVTEKHFETLLKTDNSLADLMVF